jgi:hypothetical protein
MAIKHCGKSGPGILSGKSIVRLCPILASLSPGGEPVPKILPKLTGWRFQAKPIGDIFLIQL